MIQFLIALLMIFAHSDTQPPSVKIEVSKDHKRVWWVVELDAATSDKAKRVDVLVDGRCAAVRVARPYRFRLDDRKWKSGTAHTVFVRYRDADDNEVSCAKVVVSK